MSIEQTLKKVEQDISFGDYGKARDRLHGLIATYPNDLTLRRKLGDIYWRLQYPAMAGRYWYLEENKSPDMLAACTTFEQSCGHSLFHILLSLKFRGDPNSINSEFAKERLLRLQSQVKDKHNYFIGFQKKGAERYQWVQRSKSRAWVSAVGCGVVALMALALMLVGFATVLDWVF
ncbi:MAG: DNA helicase [Chloroflexi bacterium]|nr:DNA helicase [Chloroflexota bacterium]